MGNPLLDEINGLSPGAKAALAQAHAQSSGPPAAPPPTMAPSGAQGVPPIGPGEMPKSLGSPEPMPALPAKPLPALGPAPRGTPQGDAAHLSGLLSSGSGISQIHSKIENSALGKSHPLLGKILGWGAQIPATLADVGASAVAPEITANLPGTEYHHERLIKQDQRQLGQDVENLQKQAQAGEEQAQARKALEPTPDEFTPIPTQEGYLGVSKRTGQAQPITVNGQVAQPIEKPEAQNVHVLPDGNVVAIKTDKDGNTTAQVVYHGDPKVRTEVKQLEINGRPHQVLVNSDTGEQIKDLGETGEKPPVVNVNAGNERADRNYQFNSTQLNKLSTPIETTMQRFGNLESSVSQATPEADALVAPELLSIMAGGQGSGLRMNQAEIDRIVGGRSAWENLRAAAQHWSTDPNSANSITSQQRQQIHALMDAVGTKLRAKEQILNDANEKLLGADDVQQQRQIVVDARRQLDAIDSGEGAGSGGKVRVQIPGQPESWISASQKDAFLKKYPNAKVLGQ